MVTLLTTLIVASFFLPPESGGGEYRFLESGPGIVTDPHTRLIWTKNDNGRDLDWHAALRYCETLSLGGNSDWRLPSISELGQLYDKNGRKKSPRGKGYIEIAPPFILSKLGIWSSTDRWGHQPTDAPYFFYFHDGGEMKFTGAGNPDFKSALCVREGK